MKVCSYTMTSDTGFAPNPFHGYCTLAACTPNHMGAKLVNGDWIAGFFTNTGIPSLVYAMRIDEVLGYNNYYSDIRFKRKKPRISGTPKDRCGDNIYHLDSLGTWLQDKGLYHQDDRKRQQDTRHAVVFAGEAYAYFGTLAYNYPLPKALLQVLKKGQGIKYTRKGEPLFNSYLDWLDALPTGLHCHPRDGEIRGLDIELSFNRK